LQHRNTAFKQFKHSHCLRELYVRKPIDAKETVGRMSKVSCSVCCCNKWEKIQVPAYDAYRSQNVCRKYYKTYGKT